MSLKVVLILLICFIQTVCCNDDIIKYSPIKLKGLNYSPRLGPDWANITSKCKSRIEIKKDLMLLQTLTSRIRIYSLVDCNQGPEILSLAKELKLRVWIGLWVTDDINVFIKEAKLLSKMLSTKQITAENVIGIHVGSEAIYRKEITVAELIKLLNIVREIVRRFDATSTIPLTIADLAGIYITNSYALIPAVDIVSANAFPFWMRNNVSMAVENMIRGVSPLAKSAFDVNKKFILSETGWASEGYNVNAAEASPMTQQTYFKDFYCAIEVGKPSWDYFYFTGIDNKWRAQQDVNRTNDVEGHFGLFYFNRTMKPHIAALNFTCHESNYAAVGNKQRKVTTYYRMEPNLLPDQVRDTIASESSSISNREIPRYSLALLPLVILFVSLHFPKYY